MSLFKLPSLPHLPSDLSSTHHERRTKTESHLPSAQGLSATAPAAERGYPGAAVPSLSGAISAMTWQAQASESTKQAATEKYRSAAVYCEVKLAEALGRGPRSSRTNKGPDRFRTAVCAQIFTEMCDLCQPFSRVLKRIRDELVLSVYSDYFASEDGSLHFDQVPYFVVVEKLEEEKHAMEQERAQWGQELMSRQDDIGKIEDQMKTLHQHLEEKNRQNADLQEQLAKMGEELTSSQAEARIARDELKRIRKELLKTREDLHRMKQTGQSNAAELEEIGKLKESLKFAEDEMEKFRAERDDLKERLGMSVSRADLEDAQRRIEELENEVEYSMEHPAVDTEREEKMRRLLTPRPNWDVLRPNIGEMQAFEAAAAAGQGEAKTKDIVAELVETKVAAEKACAEAVTKLAEIQTWKDEMEAVLAPDPEPRHIQPKIITIRIPVGKKAPVAAGGAAAAAEGEGEGGGGGGAAGAAAGAGAEKAEGGGGEGAEAAPPPEPEFTEVQKIETLGLDDTIPRFLRSKHHIKVAPMSKVECEELVNEVWEAKTKFDSSRMHLSSLSEFMYHWLKERFGGVHSKVTELGYNMLIALKRYAYDADLELFLKVLTGEISEEVRFDRLRLLEGLVYIMREVDKATGVGGQPTNMVGREDFIKICRYFFPAMSQAGFTATIRALETDVPDGPISYKKIFESDDDLNQGAFAEALLDQHLADIHSYTHGMVDYLKEVAFDIGPGKRVPLARVREAMGLYDPQLPQGEVDAYCVRGARLGSMADVEAQIVAGATVEMGDFISRLTSGMVKRSNNYDMRCLETWRSEMVSGIAGQAGVPDMA